MKEILNRIINTGIKSSYLPWEIHLTRKLNTIVLIGIANMIVDVLFLEIIDYTSIVFDCLFVLCLLPFVFVLNTYKNFVWGTYLFYCCGFGFMVVMNLKMGKDANFIFYYFPFIVSIAQLLGRKETLRHLVVISAICLFSFTAIIIGFRFKLFNSDLNEDVVASLAGINLILCFSTTMVFIITMAIESLKQEAVIQKTLKEKDVLLAEVFHRVKNNLNVITSLINLKKNTTESLEVKNALEDCRSRVFSMALVHNNIFNGDNYIALNFKGYVEKLITEITHSLGGKKRIEVILKIEDIFLELSNAIPCGLILNELITNSFKYGLSKNEKLVIEVEVKKEVDLIEFLVKDNGPGFNDEALKSKNTLGIELIKSLADQVNGVYSFNSNGGAIFNLKFKQIS